MNKTEMVVILKEQLEVLIEKYKGYINNGDTKKAIESIRLIKDTTQLIDNYDYKLMYSSYSTDNSKVVAVWEQNSDDNIRNHRAWEVHSELELNVLTPKVD